MPVSKGIIERKATEGLGRSLRQGHEDCSVPGVGGREVGGGEVWRSQIGWK